MRYPDRNTLLLVTSVGLLNLALMAELVAVAHASAAGERHGAIRLEIAKVVCRDTLARGCVNPRE